MDSPGRKEVMIIWNDQTFGNRQSGIRKRGNNRYAVFNAERVYEGVITEGGEEIEGLPIVSVDGSGKKLYFDSWKIREVRPGKGVEHEENFQFGFIAENIIGFQRDDPIF